MSSTEYLPSEPGISMVAATFSRGTLNVILDADFELAKGETAVITGHNGSGKSTFLYLCAGLVAPNSGSVLLEGHRANAKHPSDLFRMGIRCGFVFQEGGLLSNIPAVANVELPLRYHADLLGLSARDVSEHAEAAMLRVGLKRSDFYSLPAHLSFGNRKRLALARALAIQPNFFFFDDPDVGLDPKTAALIHSILCQYRDDPEVTMLVATNREVLIDRLETRGYVLQGGKLYGRSVQRQFSSSPPVA